MNTVDEGVVINGVKWATRNVDAPGTFAANPESSGQFYQWNRKVGWTVNGDQLKCSDDEAEYLTKYSDEGSWKIENDPSPNGWRLPTVKELSELIDFIDNVDSKKTTVNGVLGMQYADKHTGNAIFLPITGRICSSYDSIKFDYKNSVYFSRTYDSGEDGWDRDYWGLFLEDRFGENGEPMIYENIQSYARSFGGSIRCVAMSKVEITLKKLNK